MRPFREEPGLWSVSLNPGWTRTEARTPTLYLLEVRFWFDFGRDAPSSGAYPQTNEPRARNRQNECRRQEALEGLEIRPIGIFCGFC